MNDFKLDIEVKVTVKPVNPKTGTTQRGPYERNLFVVHESLKKHYVGEKTDIATLVDNALTHISRQWPLATQEVPEITLVDPADTITATGAVVAGKVHDHDQSVTVTCEYGTTTALGTSQAAAESPISGDSDQAVTMTLTGLSASTKYYYRVKATDGTNTYYSELKAFTTAAS